jgi:hypothetical protein
VWDRQKNFGRFGVGADGLGLWQFFAVGFGDLTIEA